MTSSFVRADFLAVAREYASCPEKWPAAPRFHDEERWYARTETPAGHEVWLVTWLPGQSTELHDHGESAGAFTVVSGELTEETVTGRETTPRVLTSRLTASDGRSFGPWYVHRVVNNGVHPAVSVHVYSPALRVMNRYQIFSTGLHLVGIDHAGVAW